MAEIDLDAQEPVKMFAAADNAKDYTFMLVADKNQYSERAFEWNPNVATGADLIFKSPMLPDDGGRALVDLDKYAKDIKDKLKDIATPARAVVLASSKPKNQDPRKRQAKAQRVTIKKPAQTIKLKSLKDTVSAADWICHHHAILYVEMTVRGIPQVTFELDPKVPWGDSPIMVSGVWENTAPGDIGIKRKLIGGIGDRCNGNAKCKHNPAAHDDWWPLWSTQINQKHGPVLLTLNPAQETYVFGLYPRFPGSFVLTVKGTGPFAHIVDKTGVQFTGTHSNPGD
jgi:hypothetical protein